jgi:hypothetical protein
VARDAILRDIEFYCGVKGSNTDVAASVHAKALGSVGLNGQRLIIFGAQKINIWIGARIAGETPG